MSRFTRPEVENALREKIDQNPNISLMKVILDPNLSSCVENEASQFIRYLMTLRRRKPHIVTLVDWALSDEWTDHIHGRLKLHLGQPSRNAATILSTPNQELWAELSKRGELLGRQFSIAF
jgi:hypothetical protein